MKKTLTRSKTFDSDLTKLDRRLSRQLTLPSHGNSADFDYKRETKHLSKVLKQCLTAHTIDFDFLLNYFSSYKCDQRMLVVHGIEFEYNYRLVDMVLERADSPLRACTLAMIVEPIELYARQFHDLLSSKQIGEIKHDISRVLVEILLGLNNDNMHKFKEVYQSLFENTVENDVRTVQGSDNNLTKLILELLEGQRYEDSDYSTSIAKTIAKRLYEAGEGTPGIDYDTFIKIFAHDTFSQLSAIFDIYEDKYGRPIQEAIEREFQDKTDIECFQDIVEYTRSPCIYYAKILRQAFYKTPIDYTTLARLIIGHEETDLGEIKLEYSKIYDEILEQAISNHIDNPEIKRLFLTIIRQGENASDNDNEQVYFDTGNNSSSTTTSTGGMRRNRSHDTFDKFVHVFKTIRPH